MVEQTLVLVKPDAVHQGHIGDIITMFENKQYKIKQLKDVHATKEQLANHYNELVDKPFYHEIEEYMMDGSLVAMIIEGTDIVHVAHLLAGATDPVMANPGTIRGMYSRPWDDGVIRNAVHTSDSLESARREIKIWFPEN